MFERKTAGAIALVVLGLAASVALSHEGATGIVKTRMDAMKAMAASLKPVGAIVKGQRAYDTALVRKAAETIRKHAAQVPKLFPEGSANKASEARPEIWTEWDKFVEWTRALQAATDELAQSSAEPAVLKPALARVTGACKGCHERYREEKEEEHRGH